MGENGEAWKGIPREKLSLVARVDVKGLTAVLVKALDCHRKEKRKRSKKDTWRLPQL